MKVWIPLVAVPIAIAVVCVVRPKRSEPHIISGPPPAVATTDPKSIALTVVVHGPDAYEVDNVRMDLAQVRQILADRKWDYSTALKIHPSSGSSYQAVGDVLDAARKNGIARIVVE